MSLILQPKIAGDSSSLRLWVGALYRQAPPVLSWKLEPISAGALIPNQNPSVIKNMESAIPPDLLSDNSPRTFTGIFEFNNCSPDSWYRIVVTEDNSGISFETKVKTIRDKIPEDRWFNIMIVSCYHYATDDNLQIGNINNRIPSNLNPDITFLVGDQVYLDLPTFKDFPEDAPSLAARFEQDYIRNWCGINSMASNVTFPSSSNGLKGYAKLLSLAPSISIPDDHEFWNNYPNWSVLIGNSYSESGRQNWKKAASALYKAFQLRNNDAPGNSDEITIPPVTFFLADTRSNRDADRKFVLDKNSFDKFRQWANNTNQTGLYPFFISGQSIFVNAASPSARTFEDNELANYDDFIELITSIRASSNSGRRITCITGDVHWGRLASVTRPNEQSPEIVEIISSPASLVEDIRADISGWFKKIFTHADWPKHSEPDTIDDLKLSAFAKYKKDNIHGQMGNHIIILSLKKSGAGIENMVTFFPSTASTGIFNRHYYQKILNKIF